MGKLRGREAAAAPPTRPATALHVPRFALGVPPSRRAEREKTSTQRPEENRTGLPDDLKAGLEQLSGLSLDDVRVHYDSPAPHSFNARAYAQGSEIHLAPGQEKHLAHEAWHVVQQMQGRVQPTLEVRQTKASDDPALEREAEAMGDRAARGDLAAQPPAFLSAPVHPPGAGVVQRFPVEAEWGPSHRLTGGSWMKAEVGADDKWMYGSKPNKDTPPIIKSVGKVVGGKHRYIAGHLLNDNMGGEGINKNLTVLSSDANKKHSGVETKIKQMAGRAAQINRGADRRLGDPAYDHGVKYSVEVLAAKPDLVSPFHPNEKKLSAGLKISIDPIRKRKSDGAESAWPEEAKNALADHIIENVPPYPAAPKKGVASPLQKKVINAINNLDATGWNSKEDIKDYIDQHDGGVTMSKLNLALGKGVEKQLFKKHKGKYRLVA